MAGDFDGKSGARSSSASGNGHSQFRVQMPRSRGRVAPTARTRLACRRCSACAPGPGAALPWPAARPRPPRVDGCGGLRLHPDQPNLQARSADLCGRLSNRRSRRWPRTQSTGNADGRRWWHFSASCSPSLSWGSSSVPRRRSACRTPQQRWYSTSSVTTTVLTSIVIDRTPHFFTVFNLNFAQRLIF